MTGIGIEVEVACYTKRPFNNFSYTYELGYIISDKYL